MIDRRRFVQSMIALGAAAGTRRADVLLAFPPSAELRDLADAALAAAKKAGATYADIRINRYRNQFIFTRDRNVQNIVNTEDYGFGIRVMWTERGVSPAAASSRRKRLRGWPCRPPESRAPTGR